MPSKNLIALSNQELPTVPSRFLNFEQSIKYGQNTFGNNVQSWTIFIKLDEIEVPQGVK